MARQQFKGRKDRDKKGSSAKSGWQKPDGTPLRKRKGDYFPDQEIDKRKGPKRSAEGTGRFERKEAPSSERSRPREEGRSERSAGFRNDDTARRPTDRRNQRSEGRTARPFQKTGSEEQRSERTERTSRHRDEKAPFKKPYRKEDGFEKRPFRSDDRSDSGEHSSRRERSERPARHNDQKPPFKKPFGKEEGSANRPYRSDDRRGSEEDDNHRERTDATGTRGRYKKPFEKKRERYDRIEHSKNMRGRFDKKPFDKAAKPFRKRDENKPRTFSKPNKDGSIRLNRYISNAGICSRREADDLITAGVISINGKIITELGTKVNPGDEVRFHDRVLRAEQMVYVLLNKPKDFITTTDDPGDRKTVMNLVHDACKERIFPVGRLDRNTTGLLLLTNDGELTRKLTHPSSNIKKIYQVELDKNLTQADMKKAAEGVELEDGESWFDEIQYVSNDDRKIIGVELHSGKNRIVRRIFEALGYEVKKLDRTVFAGLTKKDLPRGRWRYLTELELSSLKMTRK